MASTAGLLRKASEALERGEDPFSGEFLRDNDVTSDQCMTLAQMLALGARVVARALEDPKSGAGLAVFLEMAESP
jgi:hypothetical protein